VVTRSAIVLAVSCLKRPTGRPNATGGTAGTFQTPEEGGKPLYYDGACYAPWVKVETMLSRLPADGTADNLTFILRKLAYFGLCVCWVEVGCFRDPVEMERKLQPEGLRTRTMSSLEGVWMERDSGNLAYLEHEQEADWTRQAEPVMTISVPKRTVYLAVKRFFDVVLSAMALVVFSPLFLIVAIAIKAEDGGPVFFTQERTGLNGKTFLMYKFRTMCPSAPKLHQQLLKDNEANGPVFKIKNDPRITKVGKLLRKTSIDELPQLVNILRNEMSIVGPRPLATYEAVNCNTYQNQRLLVKPGLTCYWQCSGRSNISFDKWIEMDLQYIREANLWTDFKVICKTAVFVIRCVGAY